VFKFVWRLCWKISVVCVSLSPFNSFQSRFVTYLLNCPRNKVTRPHDILNVIGESPVAGNTLPATAGLKKLSCINFWVRYFLWRNWRKTFQILSTIQCEVTQYWRVLVCRDVTHCHWVTGHRHAEKRISLFCAANWKENICSSVGCPLSVFVNRQR
jgi:hypothetical protein